ncbi:ABC transporter substrate-binding protein [Bifidobacterium animalis subsp. lactis BS 01]|nr:ABC transporter substrate-binding protein [Bifidobacterium animalis subsp. lactis BS 01]
MKSPRHIHRHLTRIIAMLAALPTIFAVTACGSTSSANGGDDGLTKVTFMLSWAPDTNHIGVYVAKNKGYYRQAGLDVNIVAVAQSGAEQAVNNGVADFALSNLTNVSTYSTKGTELRQVMQIQQKTSAIWCALASNASITRPRDLDGKTFATFGSSESDAVVRRMIQHDGGKGNFDKVTVGTSTFQTLESGRADFGGFYSTWEGVQAKLNGPKLNCFTEPEYGVPGNADSIGIITSDRLIAQNPDLVKRFVQATQRGYEYAYDHGDEAADILVKEAPEANLDPEFVRESMKTIIDGQYWGDREQIISGKQTFGLADYQGTQGVLRLPRAIRRVHGRGRTCGARSAAVEGPRHRRIPETGELAARRQRAATAHSNKAHRHGHDESTDRHTPHRGEHGHRHRRRARIGVASRTAERPTAWRERQLRQRARATGGAQHPRCAESARALGYTGVRRRKASLMGTVFHRRRRLRAIPRQRWSGRCQHRRRRQCRLHADYARRDARQ